jgi:hypothetical protein
MIYALMFVKLTIFYLAVTRYIPQFNHTYIFL